MGKLPKLVVFDLDFTLWKCGNTWIDCSDYPFSMQPDGRILGVRGGEYVLYADVPLILNQLTNKGVQLSLASRTSEPDWANELLELMDIDHFFSAAQIYPGSKVKHFRILKELTGIGYSDMIFFDDEQRNIVDVSALGVQSEHVDSGVDLSILTQALERFCHR